MRRLILGTAGHIDHGKTALVHALTGVDTDRLPEEKRRGITIELGFAALSLDDIHFGIVDVPGHEALVRTMLAGAAGMDLVMLVIAADEGVMPQTREHLAIMELLEVRAAVVALTKSDLVDAEWLDLVTADVEDTLDSTRFAGARVIPVSSRTGDGLASLRTEIARMGASIAERADDDLFRLPVDRVFTRHGTGTVITGTVWSGSVSRDAAITVWPAGNAVRARGLQVHGAPRDAAGAGERVALALAADRDAVRRGDVLTGEPGWHPSMLVTTRMRVLPDSARPLQHRQRIRFHLGTTEIIGRAALLSGESIEPGETGWVQLRLEAPCVARAGDRFVIRAYSPVATIGGGVIAEPAAPKRKRLTPATEAVLRSALDGNTVEAVGSVIAAAGGTGVAVTDIPVMTGRTPADVRDALSAARALRIGERVFDPELADAADTLVLAAVDAHHLAVPLDRGLPREALRAISSSTGAIVAAWAVDRLIEKGTLISTEGALARRDFAPSLTTAQQATADTLVARIAQAGLEAPDTDHLGGASMLPVLRFLAGTGQIVSLPDGRWADSNALSALVTRLSSGLEPGQVLSTAELKDRIGLSRKFVIPLLEHLDRLGITRRTAENRVWIGVPSDAAETSQPTAVPAP